MSAITLLLGAAWLAFSVWTWRRLRPRGPGSVWSRIASDPGVGIGVMMWIGMSVERYSEAMKGDLPGSLGEREALLELGLRLFAGFPIYLWFGYLVIRLFQALLAVVSGQSAPRS